MIHDLDTALTVLAQRVPITDVASAVDGRLDRGARRRWPILAAAAALLAVVVITPGPRRALGRWLGFDSVRIERLPNITVPDSSPPAGSALDLGTPLPLEQALSDTGLPDPRPGLLGEPAAVYIVRPPDEGIVLLVYPAGPQLPASAVNGVGALVSVWRAQLDSAFIAKSVGPETSIEQVAVGGDRGYWLSGEPHQIATVVDGEFVADSLRLATNTLLWQRGDVVVRIEADISRDDAVRLAASI